MAVSNLVVDSTSETSPRIILHPLVLVTISDHGTRATLQKKLPIFGAILGQNNGKEVTLEIAFECGVDTLKLDKAAPALAREWFSEMIKYREFHSSGCQVV
jgi:COP9 signalosome complex subunit 6